MLRAGVPQPALPDLSSIEGICGSGTDSAESENYTVAYVEDQDEYHFWDKTVEPGRLYSYRVTQLWDDAGGVLETPFSDTNQVAGMQFPAEEAILPPPQGFKAWAPPADQNMWGINLRWCPIPLTAPDDNMPAVAEYWIYRAQVGTLDYQRVARVDPSCLDTDAAGAPINRCAFQGADACVYNHSQEAQCNLISSDPAGCDNVSGPACGIVDLTFDCYPQINNMTPGQQANYNYEYFVTAVGTDPASESMPSNHNQGWLNYCSGSECSPVEPFSERRDPEGKSEYLVCGDENASLLNLDDGGVLSGEDTPPQDGDTLTAQPQIAPHRTIGLPPVCIDCNGGGGGEGGGGGGGTPPPNPYNPPARFVFYHVDHLGSPRVILDDAGDVVERHHYLPFGEERPPGPAESLNTRAFTCHERDAETGVDYMVARYYSSSLARFMAVDPGDDTALEVPQSWNKYAYVRNNPIRLIDDTGMAAGDPDRIEAQGNTGRNLVAALAGYFSTPLQAAVGAVTGLLQNSQPTGAVTGAAGLGRASVNSRGEWSGGVGVAVHVPEVGGIDISSMTNDATGQDAMVVTVTGPSGAGFTADTSGNMGPAFTQGAGPAAITASETINAPDAVGGATEGAMSSATASLEEATDRLHEVSEGIADNSH